MEQQKKISIYLKGITAIMILGVLAAMAVLTVTATGLASPLWQFIIFTYVYGISSVAVLISFFKVCNRIGDGDSFSQGNADSFKLMERFAYVAAAAACGRIVWCLLMNDRNVMIEAVSLIETPPMTKMLFLSCGELFIFVIFGLLCRALSALILNAAEIKQENELTI